MTIHGVGGRGPAGLGAAASRASEGLKKPDGEVETRLREAAAQFEGVFIQQMLAAMRATVPESGLVDGGHGEDMFASMLDAHLAEEMAMRHDSGLADAIYRQLSRALSE